MGHESTIGELAKELEELLHLSDEHHAAVEAPAKESDSTVADSAGDGAQHNDEPQQGDSAAVPDGVSDTSSIRGVPRSPSPPSDSEASEASADAGSIGPLVPLVLTVHRPALPNGVASLFADTASTLDSVAEMIRSGAAKNIIVMAGAGISTSAGIPDFRSPGTGLYANLQKYRLPYPEAIFTIDYFRKQPRPFYVLAKELYPGQFVPTACHFFVQLLAQRGLLLRHYTQNIDCLEREAGVEPGLIVEAHGSFHEAHCIGSGCGKGFPQDWLREHIFDDRTPRCDECGSLVKPDITFFGEGLPVRFFELIEDDFAACDLLIVMGTSLQVQPFASLVGNVGGSVPRLLINRERVGETVGHSGGFDFDGKRSADSVHRDALVLGDCDDACLLFAEKLGWAGELASLRAAFTVRKGLEAGAGAS